jgi:hypothetical protein
MTFNLEVHASLNILILFLSAAAPRSHVSLSHYLVMKASFVWVAIYERDNVILFLLGKPCLVRKTSNRPVAENIQAN